MLPKLALFSNVPITRDYSTVRGVSSWDWLKELYGYYGNGEPSVPNPANVEYNSSVNYYRVPDKIRIEDDYNYIRHVTYGALYQGYWDDDSKSWKKPSDGEPVYLQTPCFFWVDDVRIVKGGSLDRAGTNDFSVLELTVRPDPWANNYGNWTLHDSYVVRRHVDRFTYENGHYVPIYYPTAAEGMEGSYLPGNDTDLFPAADIPDQNGDPTGQTGRLRALVLFALDNKGTPTVIIGADVVLANGTIVYTNDINTGNRFLTLQDFLDGNFVTASGITAEYIQSIVVVPMECICSGANTVFYENSKFYLDVGASGVTTETFTFQNLWTSTSVTREGVVPDKSLMTMPNLFRILMQPHTVQSANPEIPDWDTYATATSVNDAQEPLLWMEPARRRFVTDGTGKEIFKVPDVRAFEEDVTVDPVFDFANTEFLIYAGSDMQDANVTGAMGTKDAIQVPIYNSAWQSYKAIQQASDNIQRRAAANSALANGITGTAMGALGGGMMAGVVGMGLGLAGGVVGTAAGIHSVNESYRAKRVLAKNSPCSVSSLGRSFGQMVDGLDTFHYITARTDDVTMAKLREDYYWKGYFVERTVNGTISLDTREYFDYIRTDGAKIRGYVNAGDATAIAAILDAGVTIVHERSWMFNPDATKNNRENTFL